MELHHLRSLSLRGSCPKRLGLGGQLCGRRPCRTFHPTAYAQGRGTWQSDNAGSEGNTFWLLRSNGFTASHVVYVGELGHIYNRGIPVTCQDAGLVPAIRIDLETAAYSYTGTVSSRDRVSGN